MRMRIYMLIAALAVACSAAALAAVVAEVETEGQFRELKLIGIEDGELAYSAPNAPEGVQAGLDIGQVDSVVFEIEFDQVEVFQAERERKWITAARIILKSTLPTLPFLSLPENNAVEPAFRAGELLESAAHYYYREGGDKTESAAKIYEQARKVLAAVAKAEWNYLAEPAELKAIGCQVMLGELDEAEKALAEAREPQPYDGAYGQYWLTKGRLLLAKGEARAACNALAKVVVFDSKNVGVFPDALLLFGKSHEELTEYHRARDIYYELGRLFTRTEWGEEGIERLRYIMENDLTADREKSNIAKVFFGIEEDMNAKSNEFLDGIDQDKEKAKEEGNQ